MRASLIVKIFIGIVIGILIGLYGPLPLIRVLASVGFILGQYIRFVIPLLVVAFVAKGVADFGGNVTRGLVLALVLAYTSTVLGELLGFTVARFSLVRAPISSEPLAQAIAVEPYLRVEIPAVMSIMSALVLAIVLGLGVTWVGGGTLKGLLDDFHAIISRLIRRGLLPVFPFFVATVFMEVAAKGQLLPTAAAFARVLLLVIPTQWVWLFVLYMAAYLYTRHNVGLLLRNMLPAYFTALGTMSSAATLPVALEGALSVPFLRKETVNFALPLFNITHLPGAALAITMAAMTVFSLTTGQTPTLGLFLPFMLLLGIIEVAAVGVPGGSVAAALGILESVLGFDDTGLGLMVALFMIQDSFGTATNVTGDGALATILDKLLGSSAEGQKGAAG